MNEEQLLKALAQSALREPAPRVDVRGPVLRHIQAFRQGVDRPMAYMAGLSAVAAAILFAYSAVLYSAWRDPMTTMLVSSMPVLQ